MCRLTPSLSHERDGHGHFPLPPWHWPQPGTCNRKSQDLVMFLTIPHVSPTLAPHQLGIIRTILRAQLSRRQTWLAWDSLSMCMCWGGWLRPDETLAGSLFRPWFLPHPCSPWWWGIGIWEVEEVVHCVWGLWQSRPCQRRHPRVPTVCNDLRAIKGQQGLFPLRRMDGKGEGSPGAKTA